MDITSSELSTHTESPLKCSQMTVHLKQPPLANSHKLNSHDDVPTAQLATDLKWVTKPSGRLTPLWVRPFRRRLGGGLSKATLDFGLDGRIAFSPLMNHGFRRAGRNWKSYHAWRKVYNISFPSLVSLITILHYYGSDDAWFVQRLVQNVYCTQI